MSRGPDLAEVLPRWDQLRRPPNLVWVGEKGRRVRIRSQRRDSLRLVFHDLHPLDPDTFVIRANNGAMSRRSTQGRSRVLTSGRGVEEGEVASGGGRGTEREVKGSRSSDVGGHAFHQQGTVGAFERISLR